MVNKVNIRIVNAVQASACLTLSAAARTAGCASAALASTTTKDSAASLRRLADPALDPDPASNTHSAPATSGQKQRS